MNAGSTPTFLIEFFDKKKLPYAPSSFKYRIVDVGSGTVVHSNEDVLPSSRIFIDLTPTDTAILNSANTVEKRRIAWVAGEGTPQQETGEYFFDVRNVA